ncbi:hypothetical protein ZL54_22615 [Salmonella enterica subsp. enterica]|nr:hypothetical protein [Salmonella enterica subsp. enterica]EEJ7209133.1 hypothetical protein [Salmonella enterica subsp. enterica]
MAVSQDVQDAITTAVTAATTAAMDLQTEALKAANGRGKMPDQLIEVDELDSAGKPTGNKIKVSTVTGLPPKNSLDIYLAQKGPEPEQPDWNWNPSAGADAIPVKTPQQIADEEAARLAAAAKAEQARKEFEENMANIWTPNPQDAVPSAPTPKRENPYKDPYAAPDFALLADPVTGVVPGISARDPWSGKWSVQGTSGLTVESADSAAAAASLWNTLVAGWKKP